MQIDIGNIIAVIIPIIVAFFLNWRSNQSETYQSLSDTIEKLSRRISDVQGDNEALSKRLDVEIEIRKALEKAIREKDAQLERLRVELNTLRKKYERERKEWISKGAN